jgi:hypothetical protein
MWRLRDMPTVSENVRSSGKTGSDRRTVRRDRKRRGCYDSRPVSFFSAFSSPGATTIERAERIGMRPVMNEERPAVQLA